MITMTRVDFMSYQEETIDRIHYLIERAFQLKANGNENDAQTLIDEAETHADELRKFTTLSPLL